MCEKIVAINPGDYAAWYTQSKLLKMLAKYPKVIIALETGLKCDGLKNHPKSAQQMYFEMGSLCEERRAFRSGRRRTSTKLPRIRDHTPHLIWPRGTFPCALLILARAAGGDLRRKTANYCRKAKRYDDALAAPA